MSMTYFIAAESLDVIYVNIWAILISLINLVLIFLILKKFLFKPVVHMVSQREEMIASKIQEAEDLRSEAEEDRAAYAARLAAAEEEATEVIRRATISAERTSDEILAETQNRVATMMRKADEDIAQEKKRVIAEIKDKVSDISMTIAERVVGREMREEDHRALIHTFIEEVGETND